MALQKHFSPDEITPPRRISGFFALTPLLVFLLVYVVTSILAKDFYKVPVTAAFLVASVYAMFITPLEKTDDKLTVFSKGASNGNVLLMIWIFVLAGAFAATAKDIGAIEATVNGALRILPGKLIYAGLFLASCFISMAIGTSVGTIVALSFISDTTVAATKTQGCSMKDKFKVNLWIAAPAALVVTVLYVVLGLSVEAVPAAESVNLLLILPYLLVIGLALCGVNVVTVLATGIVVNGIIGWCTGAYGFVGWMASIGGGIGSMGELIIVSLLAGGMLELIRYNGGLDYIIGSLTKRISGRRVAGFTIAALVSLVNVCTANNTIAIITTGPLAKDITDRFGLDPRKTASILDTFSCFVQGILPYGAQMLMAAGLSGAGTMAIIGHLYYPFVLGLFAVLSILLRFPRKYS